MTAIQTTSRRRETWLLAGLMVATAALTGMLLSKGLTTKLEAVSVLMGAWCVWLTVRENVWNFPIGMANVATFFVLFAKAGLLADAGLQVVYFVLGGIGWYLWLFGGAGRTPLRVASAAPRRRLNVGVAIVLMWGGIYVVLRLAGGSSPAWDALTTAISLGAQWLTDRKNWESWVLWIVADAIYVPLYVSKELYLTAGLYSIFLVMAVIGLLSWRRTMSETVRGLPA